MNHVTIDLNGKMLEFLILGLDALMNQAIYSTEATIVEKMDTLVDIYTLRTFLQQKREET